MNFLQICEYSSLKIFPINGSLIQELVNICYLLKILIEINTYDLTFLKQYFRV
jgi:hypothetical protein